jgi:L-iditol 2-dehydrogenase
MKVLRLHAIHDLRLADEPAPVPGPQVALRTPILGDVLVKVAAVGICGSDAHWYTEGGIGPSRLVSPLVLGHEFTATVVGGKLAGQRVAVDPALPCGVCEWCQEGNPNLCPSVRFAGTDTVDGSMQEYMLWPAKNLFPLPDNLSNIDGWPAGRAPGAFLPRIFSRSAWKSPGKWAPRKCSWRMAASAPPF